MTSPKLLLASIKTNAKKQLGQNFLAGSNIGEMIVSRAKISHQDIVVEIGAGLGALTIPLAAAGGKIFAVEKDRNLIPLLIHELEIRNIDNVVLLNENIFNIDLAGLSEKEGKKIIVVGNLPYNVSSRILFNLINSRQAVSRAVLMFQKELALRLTAEPCCKDYGRITVMLKYCAEIKTLATVNRNSFFPRPKVDSQVLEIQFRQENSCRAKNEELLYKIIKAAFGKRRKTLKNALSSSELTITGKTAVQILEEAGIAPVRRAETLTVSEFVKLSNVFTELQDSEIF